MPGPESSRPRQPGAVRAWVVWWALLAALWLALVDNTPLPELVTGAVAAAIAATGAVLVRGQRRVVARPDARWLRRAWRPLVHLVTDLRPLVGALPRRGAGSTLAEVPYAAVSEEPRETAHRVLTQALGSLGPNTIVVDVDPERGTMLVHQLVPTPDPAADAQPLGDRP
jgi:multisubunit Na+/H+ antiporter MnhE subunit